MAQQANDRARRKVIKTVAAATAILGFPMYWKKAAAADGLVIGDPGGTYRPAYTEAFYKPFTKETGINIISVARRPFPAAEFKVQVDTNTYNWDLCGAVTLDVAELLADQKLADPLDLSGAEIAAIAANMKSPIFLGIGVFSFVNSYRSDKVKEMTSFADVWDVTRIPGRRAIRKVSSQIIEMALRADGVAPADVLKVLSTDAGLDRAFRKLSELKPNVKVWWEAGAQGTQLLQTGEADICPQANSRAQAAIDAGAPVKIDWRGGFYSPEGWVIPRNSPKADIARRFVKFTARPERQAVYATALMNGPTHPDAYKYIDAARARALPTHPDNLKVTNPFNDSFWARNKARIDVRFNEWLLK